jgi:hypothetical protein
MALDYPKTAFYMQMALRKKFTKIQKYPEKDISERWKG